ncbi:MAG TPA: amidohydrolase family protein [Steroidobacteraceae bacterium]|nr:amidohydrolase family protein [Steroidobacteraceae bacterium]
MVSKLSARRLLTFALLICGYAVAENYDIVIEGGRVMDPETGLDAVRNVGITHGKVVRISSERLAGARTLAARGLVVAPGFVDLHQHAQDSESGRLKALDGVTTALEMEIGVPDVAKFLQSKRGHSLINYGTSASHVAARAAVFGAPLTGEQILPASGPATNDAASEEQIEAMEQHLGHELDAGGLGVGMGIEYTPGASHHEVIRMFRLAAQRRVPVFTHIRSANVVDPGSGIESVEEVIGAAAVTGASLHIVHINSMCTKRSLECLAMIAGARARGLDVTTEAYPYGAAMTYINSAAFNPGWRESQGLDYGDLALPETGERLTKQRFDALHASPRAQLVLMYVNPESVVEAIVPNPLVIIASDGGPGHPRNAGTYSRILSHYVRDLGSITLMDALRKMSLLPAQRMEKATAAGRYKGRLQEGADADIVVFDAGTVLDHATYKAPNEPSSGMHFVIVNGVVLIEQGALAPNTFPGKPL